jgi:cystathionine gamma-synthase
VDFETRAIHEGQEPDPATGALITPIYQTSTYVQEAVGENKGYDYSRVGNPTRHALERCLASLENAQHGVAYSSGLGATTTLMHLVNPGERVVLIADVYGGVYRMTSQIYEPKGYLFEYVRAEDFPQLADHLDERTRIVWVETPSNPMLNVVDIRAAAEAAHAADAILVVDNTFASPYLQNPLDLGADVVIHSTTKYLGGHSDIIGGFVATNDPTIAERLFFLQKSLGAVPSPFDCWLVLRGVKTLALRMERHCENARRVAAWLTAQEGVERVLYPGLVDHPGHEIATRQMRDFGGMISFLVESEEAAVELVGRTKVWKLAESLGGVESLIEHPARMTHASTADAPFAAPRNLIRLSVGIESADDLVADLRQALVRAAAATTYCASASSSSWQGARRWPPRSPLRDCSRRTSEAPRSSGRTSSGSRSSTSRSATGWAAGSSTGGRSRACWA